MRLWRLCRRRHAAFDGEGARLEGGRWNRPGSAVVYTSATLSLAVVELLVHVDPEQAPADLVALAADVPDDLPVQTVAVRDLPASWRRHPAPPALAEIGARWLRRKAAAVLSVPSAVVPEERNFLLDPAHADFARIRVAAPAPFRLDPRFGPARR
jgi:RES domain-containing protein